VWITKKSRGGPEVERKKCAYRSAQSLLPQPYVTVCDAVTRHCDLLRNSMPASGLVKDNLQVEGPNYIISARKGALHRLGQHVRKRQLRVLPPGVGQELFDKFAESQPLNRSRTGTKPPTELECVPWKSTFKEALKKRRRGRFRFSPTGKHLQAVFTASKPSLIRMSTSA
jgi:hypothetical protein